jgi:hypothetical protein
MSDEWEVIVYRNGQEVVTIGSRSMSGREISQEDEKIVRKAANHLLAFIGDPVREVEDKAE